ncbi:MAG: tetratricopeptide repeat protein [Solirubrobacteraceae bacterium]|nr:tetratricopeptide repeat protein [Solirubrobacteraceae bacterium]
MRYLTNPRRSWQEDRYEARLSGARRRLRNGDYAEAARRLAPLYAVSGRDPMLRWELSSARWLMVQDRIEQLWDDGDEAAAVALAETAATAFPDEPEFPLWLGPVAVVHERFEDAAAYASLAARLAPDNPTTLFRAASFGRWGDVSHARSCLETVKDILGSRDPDEPFALLDDLPHLEAQLLWGEGDHATAVMLFRHACANSPGDHYLAADLAQALITTGEHDEARGVIDDALRAFPSEPRLLDLRARTAGY